jgi:hypothetical protein
LNGITSVPSKNVEADEGFTNTFIVHFLQEMSDTFLLQQTVLEVAKQHIWLNVWNASLFPVIESVLEIKIDQQQEARHCDSSVQHQ